MSKHNLGAKHPQQKISRKTWHCGPGRVPIPGSRRGGPRGAPTIKPPPGAARCGGPGCWAGAGGGGCGGNRTVHFREFGPPVTNSYRLAFWKGTCAYDGSCAGAQPLFTAIARARVRVQTVLDRCAGHLPGALSDSNGQRNRPPLHAYLQAVARLGLCPHEGLLGDVDSESGALPRRRTSTVSTRLIRLPPAGLKGGTGRPVIRDAFNKRLFRGECRAEAQGLGSRFLRVTLVPAGNDPYYRRGGRRRGHYCRQGPAFRSQMACSGSH